VLQQIKRRLSRLVAPKLAGADRTLFDTMRTGGLTYLTEERFLTLGRELDRAAAAKVPGAVLEFGVAAGGSAVFLARRALAQGRTFVGYDLFGQIPPPGPDDPPEAHERHRIIREGKSEGLAGAKYYGYEEDLFGKVSALLASHGAPVDGARVTLVKGLFQDTVPGRLPDPVVLAHVDCDWYEPVQLCLAELAPRMRVGAAVVLDDYADWEGCRRAADEFLACNPNFAMTQREPNAVIRRQA
jgi:O-methyltransferase